MNDDAAYAGQRVGQTLCGKYKLDAIIGVGGMASVYKGVHRNGHRVAIKMLHPAISASEALRARFLREGYVANAVDHPGSVRVLDDDTAEDGSVFLVMELLEGETLRELWERAGYRLPIDQTAAFAHQLLDVLAAAHAKGIVHRDIKPDNLFVTGDGRLRVLDFGIARMRDASGSSATRTGGVMGTPAFMPREQALGWVKEIDGRTDLWAVGATMFTLISGEMVHTADTPEHIVVLTATQPARPFASVASVPPAIAAVVDRALAFAKDDRFPDARSMQQALEQAYLVSFGVPLSGPGPMAFGAARSPGTAPLLATPGVLHAAQLGTQPATASVSTTGGVAAVRAETLAAPTPSSHKAAIIASIMAGAAVVALGATIVLRLARSSHPAPLTEGSAAMGAPAPPPPASPPPALRSAPPIDPSPAAPAADPSAVLQAIATAAPVALPAAPPAAPPAKPSREPAHATPTAPRPAPVTTLAPKPPAAPPAAPAAPVAPATPNCDPPWFVDPVTHGRKVKPGC